MYSPGSVVGPVLFSIIYISPIAHSASLFNVRQQQNTQMIPNSCYSSLRPILQTDFSTYSNVHFLSEAASFFMMALLSNLIKLKSPAFGTTYRIGDSLSAVSPPFKWLMPLSHLVTTLNYSVSHLIVA